MRISSTEISKKNQVRISEDKLQGVLTCPNLWRALLSFTGGFGVPHFSPMRIVAREYNCVKITTVLLVNFRRASLPTAFISQ